MAGAVITRVSSVEQETKQSRPYRQCAQGSQCVCVCVCVWLIKMAVVD